MSVIIAAEKSRVASDDRKYPSGESLCSPKRLQCVRRHENHQRVDIRGRLFYQSLDFVRPGWPRCIRASERMQGVSELSFSIRLPLIVEFVSAFASSGVVGLQAQRLHLIII